MLFGSTENEDRLINLQLIPRLRDYINCFNIVGIRKYFSFEQPDLVPTLADVEAARYHVLNPAEWKPAFLCPFQPANLAVRQGSMFLLKSLYPLDSQLTNNLTAKNVYDLVFTNECYNYGFMSKVEIRSDRGKLMPIYIEFVRRFTNSFATLTMDFVI